MNDLPPLSDEDRMRMIGARSGLISALVQIRKEIAHLDPTMGYGNPPPHHTAKRRALMVQADALRPVERWIDDAQKRCAERLALP